MLKQKRERPRKLVSATGQACTMTILNKQGRALRESDGVCLSGLPRLWDHSIDFIDRGTAFVKLMHRPWKASYSIGKDGKKRWHRWGKKPLYVKQDAYGLNWFCPDYVRQPTNKLKHVRWTSLHKERLLSIIQKSDLYGPYFTEGSPKQIYFNDRWNGYLKVDPFKHGHNFCLMFYSLYRLFTEARDTAIVLLHNYDVLLQEDGSLSVPFPIETLIQVSLRFLFTKKDDGSIKISEHGRAHDGHAICSAYISEELSKELANVVKVTSGDKPLLRGRDKDGRLLRGNRDYAKAPGTILGRKAIWNYNGWNSVRDLFQEVERSRYNKWIKEVDLNNIYKVA